MKNMSKLMGMATRNRAKSKAAHEKAKAEEETRRQTAAAHTVKSSFETNPHDSDLRCLTGFRSLRSWQRLNIRVLCQ